MSRIDTAALPVAFVSLRILIVLNWLFGAAILALLLILPNRDWIMRAFDLAPGPQADRIIFGMRAVAVIGLVAIPINHLILKRLVAMIETVRAGDPFVAENAYRLQAIAWFLLILQLLAGVIGLIGEWISTRENPVEFGGFSVAGWLAVLLTFILARVFAEGTLMRRDLEGTI